MQVECRTLAVGKAGNAAEDYEDAAWPLRSVRRETRAFRCAVADGATEASFSGLWSRMLVRAHCAGHLRRSRFASDVANLAASWAAQVGNKPLPWYAEEKLRSGAFSSLLGFWAVTGGRWEAIAVGDTCLVQTRGGRRLRVFPIDHSSQFSSRPHLIGTTRGVNSDTVPDVISGAWQSGDNFYLMTDAIAAYCLAADERGEPPWGTLEALMHSPASAFTRWIAERRADRSLRNDDVTVLRIVLR
jgi:hypothetical protein